MVDNRSRHHRTQNTKDLLLASLLLTTTLRQLHTSNNFNNIKGVWRYLMSCSGMELDVIQDLYWVNEGGYEVHIISHSTIVYCLVLGSSVFRTEISSMVSVKLCRDFKDFILYMDVIIWISFQYSRLISFGPFGIVSR